MSRRGFSLLEVMVALSILVVSLALLVETQSNAAVMTDFVMVPPDPRAFLDACDEPRRTAIQAALTAQSKARADSGKKIVCGFLGHSLTQGGYV